MFAWENAGETCEPPCNVKQPSDCGKNRPRAEMQKTTEKLG
jgi:hypothetical protein